MNTDRTFQLFSAASFVYCLLMALYFEPVTVLAKGDAPAYIELAKQLIGLSENGIDLSHRQPLYAFFIAPFIWLLGDEAFVYPVMYLQFFLVFLTSIITYKLFSRLNLHKMLPLAVGVLCLLNLSTLFYAFNILSETLSQLVFVLLAYVLIANAQKSNTWLLLALGALAGLMVLARFNTLGLPIIVLLCLLLIHYRNHGFSNYIKLLRPVVVYSASLLFVLNSWCLFNHYNRGFYGLFPPQHFGQRWAVPATISEENTVSPQHQHLLDIFIKARQEYFETEPEIPLTRGSFLQYKFFKSLNEMMQPSVSGYKVYLLALPEILEHYGLEDSSEDVASLGVHLAPFYYEIAKQNQQELFKLRMYSLLGTFRASGVTLPVDEKVNLNALPSSVIQLYKLLMFAALTSLFVIAFFHFLWGLRRFRSDKHWQLLLLILLIAYFPAVHFYANVLSDANRFKYPAEPIMLGLFVYYVFGAYSWAKKHWWQASSFSKNALAKD